MTPETALAVMSICAIIGTGLNVWLTLRISNSIMGLKLWVREIFVAKEDMTTYLSPLKEAVQMGQSRWRQGRETR